VEHLQVLQPKDAGLLKLAHAVASMQPTHATSDGPWVEARLGHGTPRQKGAYAWRQALDQGAVLACGSDFPVESPDPRAGLESAETRQWGKNEPPGGWMPEQRLTRAEAVRCFTQGAAFAEHAEGRRGTLKEGSDADLTAFGGDVMTVPAAELHELAVLYTVVGGRVEYAR
jgi:predicted amidohydrolase YtcJ